MIAMWRHRKELFATSLLVLAAACGGASQHPQPKPECHDTDGHRIACVRVGRK